MSFLTSLWFLLQKEQRRMSPSFFFLPTAVIPCVAPGLTAAGEGGRISARATGRAGGAHGARPALDRHGRSHDGKAHVLGSRFRLSTTRSMSPYSRAWDAVMMKSRSLSRSTFSGALS